MGSDLYMARGWDDKDKITELRAENERLRGLWQDQRLISDLFLAHMRGDVESVLREALSSEAGKR